jgi:hypothetical protein
VTNNPPAEPIEYTPEQRKLLGKAYRLILSWPRDKATETLPAPTGDAREEASPKDIVHPRDNANARPRKKRR